MALVDDEDFEELSKYKWRYRQEGRVGRAARTIQIPGTTGSKDRRILYMHRQIMKAQPGQIIDHKNCDGLDNRKENLRFCTSAENARNARKPVKKSQTSKYKGVHRTGYGRIKNGTRGLCWRARIHHEGQTINLGRFSTELQAHAAYCEAALKLRGEFARTE